MTARRFSQIFWGLILVIVDVTINGVDLLPDFVGYGLVAIGAGGLTSCSPRFGLAAGLSWALLGLSLLQYVIRGELLTTIQLIEFALDCAMVWSLLGGVMAFAEEHGRSDLAARASRRRVLYVILSVAGAVLARGPAGSDFAEVLVLLVIASIIVLIMILHLLRRVRRELAVEPPGAAPLEEVFD